MDSKLNFLSNNVNGFKSSKKRIKMFEYFRNKVSNNGIFLQETHSTEDAHNKWWGDFQGQMFFSHGTTNSYGVMIGSLGNKKINCNKIRMDNNGRIIVLEAEIDDKIFFLINLYNPNTEAEQVKTLCELERMLDIFSLDSYKNIIFAGDFSCFFNSNLEASGGNPALKKKSVSKLIQLLEKYDLIDIWRIRNPFSKHYTFRKNHFSGYIQRRVDYIFVSNTLQESLQQTSILLSFCSDNSPILFRIINLPKYLCVKTFGSLLVL